MKKCFCLILAALCLVAMTACGQTGTKTPAESLTPDPEPARALEVVEKVWAEIPEDKRMPVFGGDSSAVVEDAPGTFDLSDDGAVYTLLIPQEDLDKLDGAAAMVHALMRNVFTCSAVHMAPGNAAADMGEGMYQSVVEHQFDCGAPEQVLVAVIGTGYVVTGYGTEENMNLLAAAIKAVYPGANVMYQEFLG